MYRFIRFQNNKNGGEVFDTKAGGTQLTQSFPKIIGTAELINASRDVVYCCATEMAGGRY